MLDPGDPMATARRRYVPAMSDASVKAKTGRDWKAWFGVLDRARAARLDHGAIAAILSTRYRLPGWWCQTVAVEYERARGLRERHETSSGFSVAVSKTISTTLGDLFDATADPARRRRWFPPGTFAQSTQTKGKYLRGSWNKTARLNIGFYARGARRAQIAVQVEKLGARPDVDVQRAAWKQAFKTLQQMVEAASG